MPKPIFTSEQLEMIKNRVDPLLVPIALWTVHIENNSRIRFDNFLPTPGNIQIAGFIVPENEWFLDIVRSMKNLYFEFEMIERLWFIIKLEPKNHIKNRYLRCRSTST